MKKVSLILAAAVVLAGVAGCKLLDQIKQAGGEASGAASTGSAAYQMPFEVKVAGQGTVAKNAICAAIAKPVANDAAVEVSAPVASDKMVIINAFPCDADGNAQKGAAGVAILFKKGKQKGTLAQTMNKKKLPAGKYIMNVVADSKTARVFFVVK